MNKLLSIALASALFATTGFASTGALTIAENGEVEIVGDTTANITSNAGTLTIKAGKTLKANLATNSGKLDIEAGATSDSALETNSGDITIGANATLKSALATNTGTIMINDGATLNTTEAIANSGSIKILVTTTGTGPETVRTYGHIENGDGTNAYTINQQGWNATANNNKGAAEGLLAFVVEGGASAEVPVTCELGLEDEGEVPPLSWSPALTEIFGAKYTIAAQRPGATESDPDINYELSDTGLKSDKGDNGTMTDVKIQNADQLNKFFGRLNITGLTFTVTDPNEQLRKLIGIQDADSETPADQTINNATPVTLPRDVILKAKITGAGALTFNKKDGEENAFKVTLNNDMSQYTGTLTTDGSLEIAKLSALPGGKVTIADKLIINAPADGETGTLELTGTSSDAKHVFSAKTIELNKNFTVGAYGKLILGSND